MPAVDPVILQLRAEMTQYKNELRATATLVDRQLGQQERAFLSLEQQVERSSSRMASALGGFRNGLTGLLAGVSIAAIARQFLSLTDTAKTMEAQLSLATAGFGSFSQAQDDVRRIAADTRSSLEATTKLYGGFARAAQETGRSQEDAARATQTFAEALKIGGAGTAEAESATLQFNQALQSGALRGDEFNSIMEASPRIARLLADALGVPIGQLRKMAEEGEITSDVLYRALTDRRFTDGIDAEFQQLPKTFGDAMQAVENAAIRTFGAFDSGGEFSNALVAFLGTGTETFEGLEDSAEQLGLEIRSIMEGLGDVFDPMLDGANSVFDAIGVRTYSLREQISSLLGSLDKAANLAAAPGRFTQGVSNRVRQFFGYQAFALPGQVDMAGNFNRSYEATQARGQQRIRNRQADALVDDILGEFDSPSRPRPVTSTGGGKKTTGGRARTQRSPLDPEAFAREEAQLNQAILRGKGDQAQTAEEVADLDLQRIASVKAQYEAETKADKRFTEPQKARLIALNDLVTATEQAAVIRKRDIEIEQRASEAIRRQYETGDAAAQNRIDEERSRLDLARTVEERRAIELRILDLAQAQERAEQEHLIALQRRVLADTNATPDARADAQAAIARAEARLGTLATTQANERRVVSEQNDGPLAQYLRTFDDPKTQVEAAVVARLRDVDQAIADAAADTLGVKDPLLRSLLRIFLQQNVLKPLYEGLSGGSGNIFGTIGSLVGLAGGGGGFSFTSNGAPPPIALPGMAGGGSMHIAGNPGLDRNVLSINGRSVARVNRGETINVSPAARAMRGPTIVQQTFVLDVRQGITTPQLLQHVNEIARREATQAGAVSYQQSMRDAPGAVGRAQRYGTT